MFIVLEALILTASLSLDAFMASLAYGSSKIKIPFLSVQIINVVCSFILGISLLVGTIVRQYLPDWLTTALCFSILFVLGVAKLSDGVLKSIIRKHTSFKREFRFSMFNFQFILSIYADPEVADVDVSRNISPAEAFSLALALSLDGLAVGFGAGLGSVNALAVFLSSLVTDVIAVMLGCFIGNKLARKVTFNLSWLCGLILIVLAVTRLL